MKRAHLSMQKMNQILITSATIATVWHFCNVIHIKKHVFFGECPNCSGTEKVTAAFDRKGVDEVEFKQWTLTDRSTFETQKLSADDFITSF